MAVEARLVVARVSTPAGGTFLAGHLPPEPAGAGVLIVPPFAEELNQGRRALAECGRALARSGIACVLPDLTGTGDSAGDFSDARWDAWVTDLDAAALWLAERCRGEISVLAVRAGALLAADWASRCASRPSRAVLWQPALSGEQWLRQFLRLRVIADKFEGKESSTAILRGLIEETGSIEVAGYELGRSLTVEIEARSLGMAAPARKRVCWMEVGSGQRTEPAGPTASVIGAWRAAGIDVQWREIADSPFWGSVEIVEPRRLIETTVAVFSNAD